MHTHIFVSFSSKILLRPIGFIALTVPVMSPRSNGAWQMLRASTPLKFESLMKQN